MNNLPSGLSVGPCQYRLKLQVLRLSMAFVSVTSDGHASPAILRHTPVRGDIAPFMKESPDATGPKLDDRPLQISGVDAHNIQCDHV